MNLLSAYCQRLPGHIYCEDALTFFRAMPSESVHCIVTSPPYYGLRDYGVAGQLGMEATPAEYVARLVAIFREARRVLRKDGTFWLNLGDTYSAGSMTPHGGERANRDQGGMSGLIHKSLEIPAKNLLMIPARVAIALQDDGWVLRSEIIWAKPAPMPESVKDRPTRSHEMVYLLTRSATYWYDAAAIAEPISSNGGDFSKDYANAQPAHGGMSKRIDYDTRNKRDVWTVTNNGYSEAHFATFPPALIEPMILAGCPVGGVVCDPFMGAGTTAIVAIENHRQYIGCDINPVYIEMADARPTEIKLPLFPEVAAREPQAVTAPLFEEK